MAETGQRRRRSSASNANPNEQAAEDRKPTERVILKRERVLVVTDILPEDATEAKLDELPDIGRKRGGSRLAIREAWVEVDRQTGDKRTAITAHAGESDTPDAKPGVYKAPTVTAWKGGRRYDRPSAPKVEASDID